MPAGGAHTLMRGWSPEEDATLLTLYEEQGPRWKLIATALGDANPRTAAMVRNRYLRILKGRVRAAEGKSRNKCGRCGLLKQGHVCQARSVVDNSLAQQQQLHEIARASTVKMDTAAELTAIAFAPAAVEVEPVSVPLSDASATRALNLGAIAALGCVESAQHHPLKSAPGTLGTLDSANPLFAPIVNWTSAPSDSCLEEKPGELAMASLPIAPACWSPETSPGMAGSPDITAASLLAPTPEGMQGMYTFPLSRVENVA